jgi:hypothetical protein
MQKDRQLPGFTAESSLAPSVSQSCNGSLIRDGRATASQVQPQGCCVWGPLGICAVASPLCP